MTLLVDAGITFVKWARLEHGAIRDAHTAVHHGVDPAEWQSELGALGAPPTRVVVANAAGGVFAGRLVEWCRRTWGVVPEFPVAPPSAFGVTNGYREPGALAIDRWLGMIAAWHAARLPLLCVSAGTAFTIDLVDAFGMHRGACSLPGARLMRESLHAQTSGVAAAALLDPPMIAGGFGVNTAGAVQQGGRLALAGLTDQSVGILEQACGMPVRVVLTGGAAPQVASLMRHAVEQVPDLVLRGLALTLGELAA
jgi:type III pantothenate kinase